MSYQPLPPIGQDDMAGSLPVAIASDQSAVPVSGTVTANIGTVATLATAAKQDTIIGHVDGIETTLTAIDGHVDGLETSNSAIQTSVELIDDAIKTDDAAFTPATTKVMMVGAEFDDSSPDSVDEGDAGAVRMSGNRNLYVRIRDNAGNERGLNIDGNGALAATVTNATAANLKVDASGVAVPITDNSGSLTVDQPTGTNLHTVVDSGTITTVSTVTSVTAIANALPAGTNAIGKLAANSGVDIGDVDITSILPGIGATNLGKAEDAAHTTGDVGVMALGVRAASPTERSAGPTDGDYEPFATNEVGGVWATLAPSVNGGLSIFRSIDLDETEEDIKTSAGNIYAYYFANTTASARYLKFYNATAANVTVGSTTPVITYYLPPTSAGHVGLPYPIAFGTAISAAVTTGVADADTGAPGTNDCILNVFYK